jgi:hypothetical protein
LDPTQVHIHKVCAHTCITKNEIVNTLANEGTTKEKPTNTPHIHIAHPTPYWPARCPTTTHDGAIRNLICTFITKEHGNRETISTKNKFPYVDKWLSNTQINQKLSNHFWHNGMVLDTQITQTLKLRYAQYMGNHQKKIFSNLSHTKIPTVHYAIETNVTRGPTYYLHVSTHIEKDSELPDIKNSTPHHPDTTN